MRGDPIPQTDPAHLFTAKVTEAIEKEILLRIRQAWKETRQDMNDSAYPDPIVHDLFPQVLKAKVDTLLSTMPAQARMLF